MCSKGKARQGAAKAHRGSAPQRHIMDEHLHKSDWYVRAVSLELAQRLVRMYHYAKGGANTGTYVHGLFRQGAYLESDCRGVAWWMPPTMGAAKATYPENPNGVLCLSRVVIVPDMPTNSASFLVGRSMQMIDRERWPCLVTYADEWRGHTGGIYRATNWTYCGFTQPEPVFVLAGRMISRKAGPKTRTRADMAELGAECVGSFRKHKFIHVAGDRRG